MDMQIGLNVPLLKTIKVEFAENGDRVRSQAYNSTSTPVEHHQETHTRAQSTTASASPQDCCCIWDEVVRMNKEVHLGNCLESVTTGLLHRLKNNSLTNQEKSSIINFLCDSGALQMHITTSVFTENDSGRKRERENRTVGRVEKQSGVGMALSSQSSDEMSGEREMSTRRTDEDFPEEEMSTTADNEPDVRVKLEKHEWIVEDGNYVVQKEVCDSEHFQSIAESTSRQHLSLQATDYNPGYANRKPISQTESRLHPHRQTPKSHRVQGLVNSGNTHHQVSSLSDQPVQQNKLGDVILIDEIESDTADDTRDLFQPQQMSHNGENSAFYEIQETNALSIPNKMQDYITSVKMTTPPAVKTGAFSLPVGLECASGNAYLASTSIIAPSSASPPGTSQNLICRFCGKQTKSVTELRNHLSSHFQTLRGTSGMQRNAADVQRAPVRPRILGKDKSIRPYPCKYCGKRFKRSMHLKNHITTHTGERPYKCGLCGKRFSRRDVCRTHMRTHGEKPHGCHFCQKSFPCSRCSKQRHLILHDQLSTD
ncbi:zinc finger protein 333-like [Ptychodera flava]|uniref:zinc finger protein 333-like n=1 Tax=Ptychodera flava TaxID=63121 RepID=UPI00396A0E3C